MDALNHVAQLSYCGGQLHLEDVELSGLAAKYGTPLYVYSQGHMLEALSEYAIPLAGSNHLICYAVKANSTLAVLQTFAAAGCGFDVVSGGELERVLGAGGLPSNIVFAGVGKRAVECARAIEVGIKCFNVESETELSMLSRIATERGKTAPISLRVNPGIAPKTHRYISTGARENKFGVPYESAQGLYRLAMQLPGIRIVGVAFHIGSQIVDIEPYMLALDRILDLIDALESDGIRIDHVDVGGGWGIRYRDESSNSPGPLVRAVLSQLGGRGYADRQLLMEPGRSLVGNAGVLLTEVLALKASAHKSFCIVDAGMNDLLRPAMYDAYMRIVECAQSPERVHPTTKWDVVGPVCESGDWLGIDRSLMPVVGEFLAVLSAGAYGMSMASNYNSRPRAAEILVRGSAHSVVRRRETIHDLIQHESLIDKDSALSLIQLRSSKDDLCN